MFSCQHDHVNPNDRLLCLLFSEHDDDEQLHQEQNPTAAAEDFCSPSSNFLERRLTSFFSHDFSHVPDASIATLRSQYARNFRESLSLLFDTIFSTRNTFVLEINSTRLICEYFTFCRSCKTEIVEFAVQLKLLSTTVFGRNDNFEGKIANVKTNKSSRSKKKQNVFASLNSIDSIAGKDDADGDDGGRNNTTTSNNNNNNNNVGHENSVVAYSSHQHTSSTFSKIKMVENHMRFKMESGIDLSHASKKQDVVLLAASGFCYFDLASNSTSSVNDDDDARERRRRSSTFGMEQETPVRPALSGAAARCHQKNFLVFLLRFCRESLKQFGLKAEQETLDSKYLFKKVGFCQSEFHKKMKDVVVVAAPALATLPMRRQRRTSSENVFFVDHRDGDDDGLLGDDEVDDERNDLLRNQQEISRLRVSQVLSQILSAPVAVGVADISANRNQNPHQNQNQILPQLIFSSLREGGFEIVSTKSNCPLTKNNDSSSCSSTFEKLKPTCQFLLKCFGLTPEHDDNRRSSSSSSSSSSSLLFSRPILLDHKMKNNSNGDDDDDDGSSSLSSSSIIRCSFDALTTLEISVIVFMSALFLGTTTTTSTNCSYPRNQVEDEETTSSRDVTTIGVKAGMSFYSCFIKSMQVLEAKLNEQDRKRSGGVDDGDDSDNNEVDDDDDEGNQTTCRTMKQDKNSNSSKKIGVRETATTTTLECKNTNRNNLNNTTKRAKKTNLNAVHSTKASVFVLSASSPASAFSSSSVLRLEKVIPSIHLLIRHWKPMFVIQRSGYILFSDDDTDDDEKKEERDEDGGRCKWKLHNVSVNFDHERHNHNKQLQQQQQQQRRNIAQTSKFKIVFEDDQKKSREDDESATTRRKARKKKKYIDQQNAQIPRTTMTIYEEFDDHPNLIMASLHFVNFSKQLLMNLGKSMMKNKSKQQPARDVDADENGAIGNRIGSVSTHVHHHYECESNKNCCDDDYGDDDDDNLTRCDNASTATSPEPHYE